MRLLLSFTLSLGLLGGIAAQHVGLVLSGGGAVGLTHIGVIKALEENDIPIDYITGSSMGALVGAMYASGLTPWQMDSLFQTEIYQLMAVGGVEDAYTWYFKQDVPDASLINLKFDLDTTLQTSLPTNLRSPVLSDWWQMLGFAGVSAKSGYHMDSLFIPFRCVASDITDQRSVVFGEGDLALAVRASMSYPFYFKPIRVNGHLMMDGGMYNNFPSDVMYDAFMPDFIIGSNVAYNAAPPDEDDLMSQLRAMMVTKTNYSVPCEPGLIIEPKTATTLFDFTTSKQAVADGYAAAMARMPEIKEGIARRVSRAELAARRAAFRKGLPAPVFGNIQFDGLNRKQTRFCENLLNKGAGLIDAGTLKPRYFRLYADNNVSGLFPQATFDRARGTYDLRILVKREKKLEVRFGGMFSSRPINTGMVGLRYNFFGHASSRLEGLAYFGKFYTAGQIKLRMDLSSRKPIYLEPAITLHRWDWFNSFSSFFEEVRPAYIVNREFWAGANAGMAVGNKGLLRLDAKYAQTTDEYYQTEDFGSRDTADATNFYHVTSGVLLERNSLNRKQHPNAGELFRAELRYVSGEERTDPGTTYTDRLSRSKQHDWFIAKVTLDKYFLPRKRVRFGMLIEGVFSTQDFFQNYTASLLRSPVFQPTPESRTYFLDNFRAQQYMAGGARAIIAVAKNKFDLRLEAYAFQPYKAIERNNTDQAEEGTAISERSFIGSGSLIWQSPLGPVWLNTSYIDGLAKPWVFSASFGYVVFTQRAQE